MLFQVTAIILLLVFYGCYFGKMFLQKRQGIQTDQIGKGKTGTAKVIETLMKITTILVPLVEVICIVFNQTMLPFGARIKGAFIAAVGDIVFVTSVVTMKNSWRAGVSETDKTELITNGIYQISRNPAFLGFDLVYIGILLMGVIGFVSSCHGNVSSTDRQSGGVFPSSNFWKRLYGL
jgi:protein-S-isoprenylcysteine O-methyltransferase Ste14